MRCNGVKIAQNGIPLHGLDRLRDSQHQEKLLVSFQQGCFELGKFIGRGNGRAKPAPDFIAVVCKLEGALRGKEQNANAGFSDWQRSFGPGTFGDRERGGANPFSIREKPVEIFPASEGMLPIKREASQLKS